MRITRFVAPALLTVLLVMPLATVAIAKGKPVAGCPRGGHWELVTLESLGLTGANGVSSADGNGDGWTCAFFQDLGNGQTAVVFRDNNVRF